MNKPFYDRSKSSLYALGKIQPEEQLGNALSILSDKVGFTVIKEELEQNVKESYAKNKVFYFEYSDDGKVQSVEFFSEQHCAVFAVDTNYRDHSNGDAILAQYSKTARGWRGVFFASYKEIIANMNKKAHTPKYTIGALSFHDYTAANTFICNLESMLLPGETWKYQKASVPLLHPKTKFQILESYLGVTSSFLVQENSRLGSTNFGKIKFSADKHYAIFNSGLLSDKVTDIFILGEKTPLDKNPFRITNPVILTEGRTQLKRYGFSNDVLATDMANFFEKLSDIVYDANLDVDVDDYAKLTHCIDDGIKRNRFPKEYQDKWRSNPDDVIVKFKQAITRAQKIARRNYKYVVPQYRPSKEGKGSIQFLMPIYLNYSYSETSKAPDFALVLSKDESFYRLETVLELSWAYSNARVLCKPDNSWLVPENIEESDDFDE